MQSQDRAVRTLRFDSMHISSKSALALKLFLCYWLSSRISHGVERAIPNMQPQDRTVRRSNSAPCTCPASPASLEAFPNSEARCSNENIAISLLKYSSGDVLFLSKDTIVLVFQDPIITKNASYQSHLSCYHFSSDVHVFTQSALPIPIFCLYANSIQHVQ